VDGSPRSDGGPAGIIGATLPAVTFPVPSPYRGYSQPTWDTVTLQSVIDAVNALKSSVDAHTTALNNLPNLYALSPLQHWLDCDNGNGSATVQTLPNGGATGTTLDVAGNVWANPGGGFNTSTDLYTTPVSGTWLCRAQMRIADGFGTNCNIALGINAGSNGGNNIGGSWVMWNKYVTGSGGRCSLDTTRIFGAGAGDTIRAYAWQDSGTTMALTATALQIWHIC
jgi:hypothetical protein